MNMLQNISDNQKHFIKDVVDNHKMAMDKIKIDSIAAPPVLGIFLQDSFSDENYSVKPCKYNGKLYIDIEYFENTKINYTLYERLHLDNIMIATIQMKFIERLVFIKQLWENGFIYFVGNLNAQMPDFSYANEKKEYNNTVNISESLSPLESTEYFKFLNKYNIAQIIPSEYLIDFCVNNFITLEERQYKEQLNVSTNSLRIAESSLNEAKDATTLARKSQRTSILVALAICCLSLWGSYWISSKVPVSIEKEFLNSFDSHMRLIENNDSIIIQLNTQLNELVISRDSILYNMNKTLNK